MMTRMTKGEVRQRGRGRLQFTSVACCEVVVSQNDGENDKRRRKGKRSSRLMTLL